MRTLFGQNSEQVQSPKSVKIVTCDAGFDVEQGKIILVHSGFEQNDHVVQRYDTQQQDTHPGTVMYFQIFPVLKA